ncbi:hypothetical protein ACFV1W_38760 [Kitasatospora sp. NPDC059648]|uniref:hypothetical protein n=1 Tax=Kitasatospora sp. NPDC059648 TaxID=3346894 RepID=UPI00368CCE37
MPATLERPRRKPQPGSAAPRRPARAKRGCPPGPGRGSLPREHRHGPRLALRHRPPTGHLRSLHSRRRPDLEHAAAGEDRTLCADTPRTTARYRHLFGIRVGARFCARCLELAAVAPRRPSVQERLHERVLHAAPGAPRHDLLAALRRGAPVPTWLDGPSDFLAQHAHLDALTQGAGPAAAFTAPALAMARAEDGPWYYLVALPRDGTAPLVARGPRASAPR